MTAAAPIANPRIGELLRELREISDHVRVRELLHEVATLSYADGMRDGAASVEVVNDLAIELFDVELRALAERLERTAEEQRREAEAREGAAGDELRASAGYAHGLAAGLALAARWTLAMHERLADRLGAEDEGDDA